MPRMDLDSPCVPVGGRVALFGGLGDGCRCRSRYRSTWGVPSGYASIGDQIGGHSSDYVDGGLITKLSQERVAPGLFLLSGVLTT